MFGLMRKLENVFAAAAFAEVGDWDTARLIAEHGRKAPGQTPARKTPPRPRLRARN